MGDVALAVVNGIAGHGHSDWYEPREVREPVVADTEQCEVVGAEVIFAETVELVLLAVLKPLEKAVTEGELSCDPGVGVGVGGTPASHYVGVAVVPQ